jgi:Z1 domain
VTKKLDFSKLAKTGAPKNQFTRQINRLKAAKQQTDCVEEAAAKVLSKIGAKAPSALVVYGDPQSGKTEMMICLTALLLDKGHRTLIHLMNDSVDLLRQSLERFKLAGLAPAPRSSADLTAAPLVVGHAAVIFCKKNSRDLQKLIKSLGSTRSIIVIDDEADYATPNAKVNSALKERTKINALIDKLLGNTGHYVGVTATPARLNLNHTFNNSTETWVQFRTHKAYTGQDVFFPIDNNPTYKLTTLGGVPNASNVRTALARFMATVAHLNLELIGNNEPEKNFTFLMHTSGKMKDHDADRRAIGTATTALISGSGKPFKDFVTEIHAAAVALYPTDNPMAITTYVVTNASRSSILVLNSKRDRATAGDKPTEPTCPFTIIIGGNIVSRGVTFPNLLSMYFTRDVSHKLQQDTYIQRARMFGARGSYVPHFELTIPEGLYKDWHRCFVFHRLALKAIQDNKESPVWIGDPRIAIASSPSIDRARVDLNKGEMSWQLFKHRNYPALDAIVDTDPRSLDTLVALQAQLGKALPQYLIDYLRPAVKARPGSLAIHKSQSITKQKSAVQATVTRKRGFIGTNQLEEGKFPGAVHHIKIMYNAAGKGRVFYKNRGGVQFIQAKT